MTVFNSPGPKRRLFLKVLGASFPATLVLRISSAFASEKKHLLRIVEFDASGARTGVVEVEKVEKSQAEWKKQLTADQFEVTRKAGTERPFSGKVRQQPRGRAIPLHLLQYGSLRFQDKV